MILTSGYALIVCVLVKSNFLYTFKRDFSKKNWTFLSLGWQVLRDFRLGVLQQHIFLNASLLYLTWSVSFFLVDCPSEEGAHSFAPKRHTSFTSVVGLKRSYVCPCQSVFFFVFC